VILSGCQQGLLQIVAAADPTYLPELQTYFLFESKSPEFDACIILIIA